MRACLHWALPLLALACASAHAADFEAKVLPSGRVAVQLGDLLVSVEDARAMAAGRSISTGNAWPGGAVYFEFNSNVDESRRALTRSLLSQWGQDTAIRLIESNTASNRILISDDPNGAPCGSSWVGMIGGVQDLLIRCWATRTIVHEFGHALGAEHEHQRSDRAGFVNLQDVNNLRTAHPSLWNANYAMVPGGSVNSAYDYASVMHYSSASSFTINQVTYTVNINALGAQPPGPPAGSAAACANSSACSALMGRSVPSARDLYGQALRYGRRLDRDEASRSLRGQLQISGHIDSCGSTCWRVPAESEVTVTLTPDPGEIAVLGGRDCQVRARGAVQCVLATDRNRRFTAFTFPAGALPQLDEPPLPANVFANGFE